MSPPAISTPDRLHWPLPAILAWGTAWVVIALLKQMAAPWPLSLAAACAVLAAAAWHARSRVRRLVILFGFPASVVVLGAAASIPSWIWLMALGVLLALYPLRAWRDAPLYPTPARVLHGVGGIISIRPDARVLDAGCGMGHALRALRREWPQARLAGVEHGWPWFVAARLRCPDADVQRGDMWARSWAECDLVYLFQRPESMVRAWRKANAEMRPGSWLMSLEFEIEGVRPYAVHRADGQRPVFVYCMPGLETCVPVQPRQPWADMPVERDATRDVA